MASSTTFGNTSTTAPRAHKKTLAAARVHESFLAKTLLEKRLEEKSREKS
jgi:hypothetical protein